MAFGFGKKKEFKKVTPKVAEYIDEPIDEPEEYEPETEEQEEYPDAEEEKPRKVITARRQITKPLRKPERSVEVQRRESGEELTEELVKAYLVNYGRRIETIEAELFRIKSILKNL